MEVEREKERESEKVVERERDRETETERQRERQREIQNCYFLFFKVLTGALVRFSYLVHHTITLDLNEK